MLSFAEEIFLLCLDDVTGKLDVPNNRVSLSGALIGAVLSELTFLGRLDSDPAGLIVLDTTATGDEILDDILASVASSGHPESIAYWLNTFMPRGGEIEKIVRQRLANKGIVREEEYRLLWILPGRRYPIIADHEVLEVEFRLRNLAVTEEVPDPRDTVIVALAHACGLFEVILSGREYRRHLARIENLAKMDFVGRTVLGLTTELRSLTKLPEYF